MDMSGYYKKVILSQLDRLENEWGWGDLSCTLITLCCAIRWLN